LRYAPEAGTVSVSVGRDQDWAVLLVQDTAVGIAAERLPHLFERFYRADRREREPTVGPVLDWPSPNGSARRTAVRSQLTASWSRQHVHCAVAVGARHRGLDARWGCPPLVILMLLSYSYARIRA
jgi:Histidine kinase-, DNA gyrase B-, and HSP90-like ATPase